MRSRNIKPGFYRNADLAECSAQARLITPGLWMMADRDGRLEDNPRQIKMELFPCDDWDCESLLSELERVGHIRRYLVNGQKIIQIINFLKHQNPHKNEPASILPAYPGELDTLRECSGNDVSGRETTGNIQSTPADSLNPEVLIPEDCTPLLVPPKGGTACAPLPGCLPRLGWGSKTGGRRPLLCPP